MAHLESRGVVGIQNVCNTEVRGAAAPGTLEASTVKIGPRPPDGQSAGVPPLSSQPLTFPGTSLCGVPLPFRVHCTGQVLSLTAREESPRLYPRQGMWWTRTGRNCSALWEAPWMRGDPSASGAWRLCMPKALSFWISMAKPLTLPQILIGCRPENILSNS